MEDRPRPTATAKASVTHLANAAARRRAGGAGGGGAGILVRVTKLEADVAHLSGALSDLRADIREVRSLIWRVFIVLASLSIGGTVMVFGVLGKIRGWF